MAVPSMLTSVPSGMVNLATELGIPRSSATERVTGMVAAEDAVAHAVIQERAHLNQKM